MRVRIDTADCLASVWKHFGNPKSMYSCWKCWLCLLKFWQIIDFIYLFIFFCKICGNNACPQQIRWALCMWNTRSTLLSLTSISEIILDDDQITKQVTSKLTESIFARTEIILLAMSWFCYFSNPSKNTSNLYFNPIDAARTSGYFS